MSMSAGDDDTARERVLIVEDDTAARRGLIELVRAWGFAAEGASDGWAALERVRAFSPGIVLADLVMPGLDGLGLLRSLRDDESLADLTYVMITAQGSVDTAVAAMKDGAYDYLTKPVDPQRLRILLEKVSERQAHLRLIVNARRRQFDVLVCWRLDRLGRSLKHLVTLLEELQALDVSFVSLGEGIDCTTPAGTLQLHILAALAQFERARIAERVRAGLARARAGGRRLGQKPLDIPTADLERTAHLSIRRAAAELGIPRSVLHRARLSRRPVGIAAKKGQ